MRICHSICVCAGVSMYIYECMHVSSGYVHTRIACFEHVYARVCVRTYAHPEVSMYVCICVYAHVCKYVCICSSLCIYVCMYVCMYVSSGYIHT